MKIIPYFAKKFIAEIIVLDILQRQNELLKKSDSEGKSYSQAYLRTIQNQLNAILNYANKILRINKQSCSWNDQDRKIKGAGNIVLYERGMPTVYRRDISFYDFEILYWAGIRLRELRA